MNPSQLIDLHGDLLSRSEGNDFQRIIGASFTTDHDEDVNKIPPRELLARGMQFARVHHNHVKGSYVYRVTPDMCTMLENMAASLEDDDLWNQHLAPTEMGICHFDQPIKFVDIRGRTMLAHWIVWGPVTLASEDDPRGLLASPTTLMVWYNDGVLEDDSVMWQDAEIFGDDETIEWGRRTIGRWQWIGAEYRTMGTSLGPGSAPMWKELRERLIAEGADPADGIPNMSRYVHALWLMLNQTFTDTSEEEADRPARRRAERRKLPSRVTVIKLRRKVSDHSDGESQVEWDHRWFVRGHYAWRKCGPGLHGAERYEKGYRRRIYIPGYVKGPEDKPLIITDKVYSLER